MPRRTPPEEQWAPGEGFSWVSPLMAEVHPRRRKAITRHFPDVANSPDGLFLSLHPYLERPPERLYSRQHLGGYLQWLLDRHDSHRRELADYLDSNLAQIHKALVFLFEVNRLPWHDTLLPEGDDYSQIRFIDEAVHPAYLRLMEGVFYPLAHALAFFRALIVARAPRGWICTTSSRNCRERDSHTSLALRIAR